MTPLQNDDVAGVPLLPAPYATPSAVNFATVVGWPADRTPVPSDGFAVNRWADGLDYPRWFHGLPNGDVLVSESRTIVPPGADRNDPGVEGSSARVQWVPAPTVLRCCAMPTATA